MQCSIDPNLHKTALGLKVNKNEIINKYVYFIL